MWPGDGRFFTSRTRSRFPLMLRLPAAWWESLLSTVLSATHRRLPSPCGLPLALRAPSFAVSCPLPRGSFPLIPRDTFSLSAILPIARGGSVRARTNETQPLSGGVRPFRAHYGAIYPGVPPVKAYFFVRRANDIRCFVASGTPQSREFRAD